MAVEIHSDHPRVLIVEHDGEVLVQMIRALGRSCCSPHRGFDDDSADDPAEDPCRVVCSGDHDRGEPCCRLIRSFELLDERRLDESDIVICASSLPDGSGLDVLAFVRGLRPDLPVILTGTPGDTTIATEAIRAGALDFIMTTGHDLKSLPLAIIKCLAHQHIKAENERLRRDLSRSLAELAIKNHQLNTLIDQLETMARTDELTGLSNRRWLNLMLEGNWADATRNDLPLAFMMLDLDQFKKLNDQLGHHYGDRILRTAGMVIEANCRQVDLPARFGGDEFCVLMSHTETAEAIAVAERILREFTQAMAERSEGEPPVGISIGLAHIDLSRPATVDQLVMHADEALYAAKSSGRNKVMVRTAEGVRGAEGFKRVITDH